MSMKRFDCAGSSGFGLLGIVSISLIIGVSNPSEAIVYQNVSSAEIGSLRSDRILINNPADKMQKLPAFFVHLNKRGEFIPARDEAPPAAGIKTNFAEQIFTMQIVGLWQISRNEKIECDVTAGDAAIASPDILNTKLNRYALFVKAADEADFKARPIGRSELLATNAPHVGSKNPQYGRGNEKADGTAGYPPVWTRIPLALAFGLGGPLLFGWGLWDLNDRRRRRRAVLCSLGVMAHIGGIALALSLGIPATWGWWI
jgi:hypothetical protein